MGFSMNEFLKKLLDWFTPSEATSWDYAAGSMWMEGYTDLEIYLELGPRPEPKNNDA